MTGLTDHSTAKILPKGACIGEIYEVIRLLGQTAMNDTYLVKNTVTGKKYVLKLLLSELAREDGFEEYFEDLRKNVGDFIHPNIVGVYKIGFTDEEYYIVGSYVISLNGAPRTLLEYLQRHGRMHEFQAKNVFLQLCSGLQHAASNVKTPMAHWDLKPSNILFDSAHLVRISDFCKMRNISDNFLRKIVLNSGFDRSVLQQIGVPLRLMPGFNMEGEDIEGTAKINMKEYSLVGGQERHERKKTVKELRDTAGLPRLERIPNLRFRALAETYMYMSPEQRAGHVPDQRSNIYTLGLIMYETLTGLRYDVDNYKMPSRFGCHPCWNEIIKRCLEPLPERRYQSLAVLQQEIIQGKVRRQRLLPLVIYSGALVLVGVILYLAMHSVYAPYNFAKQVETLNQAVSDKSIDVTSKYAVLELKVSPAGSTVEIFFRNNLVKKLPSIPDSGMRYILPPGDYLIHAVKEGYAQIKEKVKLSPGSFQVALRLNKDEPFSVRQYIYRKDQMRPEFGFPYVLPRLSLELLPIEAGKFMMGAVAVNSDFNEQPARKTVINYSFWIAKTETTQSIYESIMMENPSTYEAIGGHRPVEKVSWNKALEFCRRLNEQEKIAGRLPAGYEYRLPTEAEWEYCCRADTISDFNFGNNERLGNDYTWCQANSYNETHDVATRKANRWGIFDICGNVAEWTWNTYRDSSISDPKNPAGAKSVAAVLRGGSWKSTYGQLRVTAREPVESADFADSRTGFRIVLAPLLK